MDEDIRMDLIGGSENRTHGMWTPSSKEKELGICCFFRHEHHVCTKASGGVSAAIPTYGRNANR